MMITIVELSLKMLQGLSSEVVKEVEFLEAKVDSSVAVVENPTMTMKDH